MKNLLVFQSGGVTAVINASMVGVVREGMARDAVGEIIGARARGYGKVRRLPLSRRIDEERRLVVGNIFK